KGVTGGLLVCLALLVLACPALGPRSVRAEREVIIQPEADDGEDLPDAGVTEGQVEAEIVQLQPQTQPAAGAAVLQPGVPASQPVEEPIEALPATRPSSIADEPNSDELKRAQKQVWKRFAADYDRREPADRKKLGRKLLKLGIEKGGDPAERLVMLR